MSAIDATLSPEREVNDFSAGHFFSRVQLSLLPSVQSKGNGPWLSSYISMHIYVIFVSTSPRHVCVSEVPNQDGGDPIRVEGTE